MKVAAHLYPAAAIENAVRAGVDSVEHGSFATARDHPELLTPGTAQKELDNDLLPKRNLPLAVKSGVKIAYGTDLCEGDHTRDAADLVATPAGAP